MTSSVQSNTMQGFHHRIIFSLNSPTNTNSFRGQ